MALVVDSPADRANQLLIMTERLTDLIERETQLILAREPPLQGDVGEEKARLANLYRQEMTRMAEQRDLIRAAPAATLDKLRTATQRFRTVLSAHERALAAVREVTEGIVKAIAEEVARVQGTARGYAATGGYAPPMGGVALADKTA